MSDSDDNFNVESLSSTTSYENVRLLKLPNGMLYFGQTSTIESEIPNGFGVAIYGDKVFIGKWELKKFSSTIHRTIGIIVNNSTNSRYEGEVELSLGDAPCFQGLGQILFESGSVRCGYFEDNSLQGMGIEIDCSNDQIYVGEFRNDLFHGKGICYYAGGDIYTGEFVKGSRDGIGEYCAFKREICKTRCGTWSKDSLIGPDANGDEDQVGTTLKASELCGQHGLNVYEEFNKKLAKRIAASRANVIKMVMYFANQKRNLNKTFERFLQVIVKHKLYLSSNLSKMVDLSEITLRIKNSISKREKPRILTKSTHEHEVPYQVNAQYSPEITHENNIEDNMMESQLPRESCSAHEHEVSYQVNNAQYSPENKHENNIENTMESKVSGESCSVIGNDVSKAMKEEIPSLDIPSNDDLAPKHSISEGFVPFPPREDNAQVCFEEEEPYTVNNIHIPQENNKLENLKTGEAFNQYLQSENHLSSKTMLNKMEVPSKPALPLSYNTQQYFNTGIIDLESSKKESKPIVTSADKKLHGVRRFISAKFLNQQKEIKEKSSFNTFDKQTKVPWLDIYSTAMEPEVVHQDLQGVGKKRLDALKNTLDNGQENGLPSDTINNESCDFESASTNMNPIMGQERVVFQTTQLCVDEYNKSKAKIHESSKYTYKTTGDTTSKERNVITAQAKSLLNVEDKKKDIGKISNKKMVRLLFRKAPHAQPPKEPFPVPPGTFFPQPPAGAPPPPSIGPQPPKRPPYPPTPL